MTTVPLRPPARPAREIAHEAIQHCPYPASYHNGRCDRLTAAIETRDREAEAREAGLRRALETVAESPFGTPSWEQRRTAQFALAATPGGDERAMTTRGGRRERTDHHKRGDNGNYCHECFARALWSAWWRSLPREAAGGRS